MNDEPIPIAYADGSCIGNPGPGGWGVVLTSAEGKRLEFSGAQPDTTNNRMEITAAIEALRRLPADTPVIIRTDSQYLVKTMTLGWKRRENLDLWEVLDGLVTRRRVRWEWVRGHAGDVLNERADELARSAALGKSPSSAAATEAESADAADRSPTRRTRQTAPRGESESSKVSEAETAKALRPLLREDETLRRCANCGKAFVSDSNPPPMLVYCSLAECQLKFRRGSA